MLLLYVTSGKIKLSLNTNEADCGRGGRGGGLAPFSTNNRTMIPTLNNNAAAGYKGLMKIELLKGEGLLC